MRFCKYDKCSHPVFGTDKKTGIGYCKRHQFARTDLDKRSIIQKAMSKEKAKEIAANLRELPANKEMVNHKLELDGWFLERAKEMTGTCANCGGKTTKGDKKYWKFSIAHILEKKNFHSVSTHPLNFIELCHFGKSCHTNLDNKIIEMQDMKCWSEIQLRFSIMYPSILKEEYQFIPDVLLESLC